ncbi:hypothetical protein J056_002999 [Wallemia ichthyophaga EXF-994]|uniref:Zn(2)-C6 fungal-type domain-containing protein n=1 Tax=Wallemia ichthyophaga (strain EXF-994 / CBS 113033) TaxID=1299270 RepID=R9AMS9_WALI9|nr:uncharacterized protein J056_002999 [Wallemia ichthyophaga EXF-994]EOR03542.1 hypothetical protein J056_002999 [Wallemia ichthyophaga EXF-994]
MPKAQSDTLPKGSACLACRRKKMRCDAVKPICSNCVRSGGLECIYDNESRQSARRATKLRAYEDRIRELEDKLERVKIDSSNSNSNSSSMPSTSAEPLKITTSNWPKDFPPKDMVSYLISTFYACSPFAASDLPRQSFETRLMHLPPTSPKFPCKALCHAVFAIAFQHLPNKDPSEKHTALALEKLNEDGQSPGLMQSFPSKYSDPVRVDEDGLDIDNLMAHMIAAKCMLSLHSQFNSEKLSQSRLLFYSRVAINSLHKLMATTYDLTRLPSMIFTTYSSSASILVGAYIEAAKNLDIQAVSTIENELLTILKKLEDEARKIGLDLSETEKQTQTPKQAPPLNWILPEPVSALDMSEFDEYTLLSGSSFTATDETCWMNLSTFNEM